MWKALSIMMTASLLWLAGSDVLRAQDAPKPVDKPAAAKFTDPRDLEAFFDGVIREQMIAKHIAGVVVTVVADKKVVFSKGYGYSDIATRQPVDPDKTLFRIASISKLFSWTAVMQLVEAGQVSLDTDVNQYLKDVKIPATFDQPITLRHLLTHTAGFEDFAVGLFAKAPETRSQAELLRVNLPLRVRPPGVLGAYSNYSTALAAHVVASVSGLPWEEYIEQKILQPLAMKHTLVRQPAKEQLPQELSKGYEWKGGQYVEKGFEYVPLGPAGCVTTSAADMSRFMLAHLGEGKLESGSILKPGSVQQMRQPLYQPHPKQSAMCFGLMEEVHNGQKVYGHGGDTLYFHSLLQMFPEHGLGVFVSYNTTTGGGARDALFKSFVEHYFPQPLAARPTVAAGFKDRASRIEGEYTGSRMSHTSFTKLAALASGISIKVNKDDSITMSRGDRSTRLVEVEPWFFQEVDGRDTLAFKEAEQGDIFLLPGNAAFVTAIKRKWYETSEVQLGLLLACGIFFLTALLVWPAVGLNVRGLESPTIRRTGFSRFLSLLGWLMCLACVAYSVALGVILLEPDEIVFGISPMLDVLLQLTPILGILAALTILACLLAWLLSYWRFSGRVHYTLVALAGAGFVWFLYNWNLLTVEMVTRWWS